MLSKIIKIMLKLAYIRHSHLFFPVPPLALFIVPPVARVNYVSGSYVSAFFPFF